MMMETASTWPLSASTNVYLAAVKQLHCKLHFFSVVSPFHFNSNVDCVFSAVSTWLPCRQDWTVQSASQKTNAKKSSTVHTSCTEGFWWCTATSFIFETYDKGFWLLWICKTLLLGDLFVGLWFFSSWGCWLLFLGFFVLFRLSCLMPHTFYFAACTGSRLISLPTVADVGLPRSLPDEEKKC